MSTPISDLVFTKEWTDHDDFPTVETDEEQVRADFQLLYDEIADFINEQILPRINAETPIDLLPVANIISDITTKIPTCKAVKDAIDAAVIEQGNMPTGGIEGDFLLKVSSENYDTAWVSFTDCVTSIVGDSMHQIGDIVFAERELDDEYYKLCDGSVFTQSRNRWIDGKQLESVVSDDAENLVIKPNTSYSNINLSACFCNLVLCAKSGEKKILYSRDGGDTFTELVTTYTVVAMTTNYDCPIVMLSDDTYSLYVGRFGVSNTITYIRIFEDDTHVGIESVIRASAAGGYFQMLYYQDSSTVKTLSVKIGNLASVRTTNGWTTSDAFVVEKSVSPYNKVYGFAKAYTYQDDSYLSLFVRDSGSDNLRELHVGKYLDSTDCDFEYSLGLFQRGDDVYLPCYESYMESEGSYVTTHYYYSMYKLSANEIVTASAGANLTVEKLVYKETTDFGLFSYHKKMILEDGNRIIFDTANGGLLISEDGGYTIKRFNARGASNNTKIFCSSYNNQVSGEPKFYGEYFYCTQNNRFCTFERTLPKLTKGNYRAYIKYYEDGDTNE